MLIQYNCVVINLIFKVAGKKENYGLKIPVFLSKMRKQTKNGTLKVWKIFG